MKEMSPEMVAVLRNVAAALETPRSRSYTDAILFEVPSASYLAGRVLKFHCRPVAVHADAMPDTRDTLLLCPASWRSPLASGGLERRVFATHPRGVLSSEAEVLEVPTAPRLRDG